MSDANVLGKPTATASASEAGAIDMNIEVIIVPVSDVDRAKKFYGDLGWRLDMDYDSGDGYRAIQFTPPGSGCSIMIGTKITTAQPGSLQGLHLIVSNIDVARQDLLRRGIEVSEPFHDAGGVFHRVGAVGHTPGPNPKRKSYASYASFSDPDGNGWIFQEVTARLSPDLPAGETAFTDELANEVRRATAATKQ